MWCSRSPPIRHRTVRWPAPVGRRCGAAEAIATAIIAYVRRSTPSDVDISWTPTRVTRCRSSGGKQGTVGTPPIRPPYEAGMAIAREAEALRGGRSSRRTMRGVRGASA